MLVSAALLALQCCRLQSLSVLGVSCSPCALLPCAARGFYAGVNCASRVAVLPCAVDVCPRRLLLSVAVCPRSMRCQASMLVSTALLALQCCRVQPLSTIGVGCSRSPCALARRAARLLCWCQQRFSRCSAALCAVAVCSRRLLFSVAVCYRSISSIIARCATRLLCWCQPRFSRCSAAVYSHCLLSASAVLRRRVCPRSTRCQASKCWFQLRFSRCSAAVCSRSLSSASAALRRRVLSLDALPGFFRLASTALREAPGWLARWPRPSRLGNNFNLRLRWGTPS
jgi:hypothetical protein